MDRVLKCYNRIINNLSKQDLIRTSELNGISIYSKEISALLKGGYIERVKQGYYRIVEHTEYHSEAKLISQLYPDGIICMISALFYYGYSDRTPINWDIAIDRNTSKARFNIDYPYVKPYYIDKAHLEYREKTGYSGFTVETLYDTFMQTTPRIGFWLDNSNQTPQQTAETILNTRKPV